MRLLAIYGFILCAVCTDAIAASCTLNTSTASKTKATLSCLQKRIAKLEAVKSLTAPVTIYDDDFVRIDLTGKQRSAGPTIRLTLRIKNKTAAPLPFALHGSAELFDDAGVSNRHSELSGINSTDFAPSSTDGYTLIAAKKTRTIAMTFDSGFSSRFSGSFFDLNVDFLRFDEDSSTATRVPVPFSDIPVP